MKISFYKLFLFYYLLIDMDECSRLKVKFITTSLKSFYDKDIELDGCMTKFDMVWYLFDKIWYAFKYDKM